MDEREVVARRYGEHLTDQDLLALTGGRADQVGALRREPTLILDLLDRPAVADGLLLTAGTAGRDEPDRFTFISPFLVFAAAVHRTARGLVGSTYVAERAGPRSRVPVFDAPELAAFASVPAHQLYLAELLASYSRLAGGEVWRRTDRGWRRQRWDELDLPRLAALLDAVPAAQRPAVWRRLGDGAVFLAGVFPDHAERTLGLLAVSRLREATGLRLTRDDVPRMLESVARRAYEQVGPGVPVGAAKAPGSTRRLLTVIADRYLFPFAADWLPGPSH
ncbi:hypothetical protein MXD62_31485 [Frankia sp. Mgl5]|uniref:hypothetical protein n=1 Tax=Frankia sp. Mgl5 TaxID=2933793 RepID=UPI00200E3952|nr:hypothetical protein [Frankia sp. Mgl5]MCK9931609.1 hypothetical protein [Frankia sp. Mgl5]